MTKTQVYLVLFLTTFTRKKLIYRGMATPLNETREPEWKKAWTAGNTLLSAPPLPLLAIVGIVVFLLWVSSQLNTNYSSMQIATTNVNLFLLFLLLVLTLIAQGTRLVLPAAPSVTSLYDADVESSESSSMPWGWIVSALMLLVLISNRLHPIFVIATVVVYVYFLSA
ncbi:hypothetical protein GLYMA_08G079700v4 [Glycine max]|nr:hypothetical protein GLYMA_08G079700v4 [Glycine max]KAH1050174.1 hypothetical protein GYH30_020584 [Glycine max]